MWETPDAEQKLLKLIPYGRIGKTDDVARAAIWLGSDESDCRSDAGPMRGRTIK